MIRRNVKTQLRVDVDAPHGFDVALGGKLGEYGNQHELLVGLLYVRPNYTRTYRPNMLL